MALRLSSPPDPRTSFEEQAWQSWFYTIFKLYGNGDYGNFTVVNLPPSPSAGQTAYATNGRKIGEGAGGGTGVPVYYSNGAWRVYSTDAPVAA
jgi:hypothetical protein